MSWVRIDDGFEDHPKVDPLSDAAHRLWLRAACWCKKPSNEHTLGFVPRALLRTIAKNSASQAKLEELAQELVDATGGGIFEHGLWEVVEGGWRFHDWPEYQPKDDEERIKAARSAAGKKGAAARWGRNSSHPGTADANGDGTASAPHSKAMAKNAPEPAPDPEPEDQNTSQPDPRPDPSGPLRPIVRAGLLDAKVSAREWQIPEDHRGYAIALGLSERQYGDVVADFCEKTTRRGEPPWLSSLLCRFIEAKAQRIAQKRPSGIERFAEPQEPDGEDALERAERLAGFR